MTISATTLAAPPRRIVSGVAVREPFGLLAIGRAVPAQRYRTRSVVALAIPVRRRDTVSAANGRGTQLNVSTAMAATVRIGTVRATMRRAHLRRSARRLHGGGVHGRRWVEAAVHTAR